MKYHTHLIIGATAGIIIASHTGQSMPLFAIIGGIAGVLPDMDIYADKIHVAAHRGAWSHSLMASILAAIISFAPLYYMGYGMFSAYVTITVFSAFFLHAIADTMTYSGTYLLYPLSKRRYRGFVRYDNIFMNSFLIIICILFLAFFSPIREYIGL